ncbi:MAG: alpha/beta fold hydrolase [Caulobacteraceae bacterium]
MIGPGARRLILVLASLLVITACTPVVQTAGRPETGFSGPRLEPEAFVSSDGSRLHLTTYLPPAEPWAVIVGVHGMNSYATAFRQAGPYWASQGIAVFAYDQRGFGHSPNRGVWPGTALLTEDLRVITTLVRQRYPGAIIAVAGVSMGATVAIEAFASDRPPPADRLLLFAPGVWGWSQQAPTSAATIWMMSHLAPGMTVKPPRWVVRHYLSSDNEAEIERAANDPLIIWNMRPDSFYGFFGMMEDASQDVTRLRVPVTYFYGAKDRMMPPKVTLPVVRRLPAGARTAYYPLGWHLLLLDKQSPTVWADAVAFVRDPAAPWPSGVGAIPGAPPWPSQTRTSPRRRPCRNASRRRRAAPVFSNAMTHGSV